MPIRTCIFNRIFKNIDELSVHTIANRNQIDDVQRFNDFALHHIESKMDNSTSTKVFVKRFSQSHGHVLSSRLVYFKHQRDNFLII